MLAVHVQPRAHRDEIVGTHGDRLKIRIAAPPVEGRANQHLIGFLAEVFDVPASNVELLGGSSGRTGCDNQKNGEERLGEGGHAEVSVAIFEVSQHCLQQVTRWSPSAASASGLQNRP